MGFIIDKGVLIKYEEEPGVTAVTIPAGVTRIENEAFSRCRHLTKIVIPLSVQSIGGSAFSFCEGLQRITIPEGIREIEASTFCGCISLTEVKLPDSVTQIGSSAFIACTSLTAIRLPKRLRVLGNYVFVRCPNLKMLEIPMSVKKIGKSSCCAVQEIRVSKFNLKYASENGVLYDKFFTRLIQCPTGKRILNVPNGIAVIESEAFSDCKELISLTLPTCLTEIRKWAFSHCEKLESITLPANVTENMNDPFLGCKALKHIYVSPENKYYTSEGGILYDKQRTRIVHFPLCRKRVILADTVTQFPMRLSAGECRKLVYRGFEFTCDAYKMRFLLDAVINKEFRWFSTDLPESVQCDVLWKLYSMNPEHQKVNTRIQEQIAMLFRFLIDWNDMETAEKLLASGKFDLKKDISDLIVYANEKKQFDFQLMLMNYSHAHIRFDEKDTFNL